MTLCIMSLALRTRLFRLHTLQLDAIAVNQPPMQAILLFVVFVGICDGIAQGAIFGDVALLPPKYTQVPSILKKVSHRTRSPSLCK